MNCRTNFRQRAAAGAVLGLASLVLLVGARPAGAVVAKVGGHGYGVTTLKSVDAAKLSRVYRSQRVSRLSGRAGARTYDSPPFGGGRLEYLGGPVMHSANTHVIYWDPNGEFKPTTKGIISDFFTNVAHDSGLASNTFATAGQYTDTSGNAAYSTTFEGALADAQPYPASGCVVPNEVDKGPYATCLFDEQLQAELPRFVTERSLPKGPKQLYFLLLPHSVATCLPEVVEGSQVCSNNFFCAYHSYIAPRTANEIIYADIPFSLLDTEFAKGCQDDGHRANLQQPNPDNEGGENSETRFADVALKYISHEWVEATTDPLVNNQTAWADSNGLENGDKCNGVSPDEEHSGVGYDSKAFVPVLGGSVALNSLFNQSINEGHYYLQSEWDNAAAACLMRPLALGPAFTTNSPQLPGRPIAFSGSAGDPYGAPAVSWSFGDGATAAGTSPSHAYATPGAYTVTMTSTDALTGATGSVQQTVVVNDLPSASFSFSPSPGTAGAAVSFNGAASRDPDGAITGYTWRFGDGAIASGVAPSHAYAAPGSYTVTLTVTDSAGQSASATQTVPVKAPPNSNFTTLRAKINPKTGAITFTALVNDPGVFGWRAEFQNGKFGVFAASKAKCRKGLVRLSSRCAPAKVLFGKGSRVVVAAGTVSFTITPTSAALKALRKAIKQKKAVPVSALLTFQSSGGGTPVSHGQRPVMDRLRKK
ncbi:MAG: domain containing protein [Solirubrobacterales bacterium]|nr:domain containing protein [Solirubrobacterales bacterium]